MQRILESIRVNYWQIYWDDNEEYRNVKSVVVQYRNIIDGIRQSIDTIVIKESDDYSVYDYKIQQFCKLAFENNE